MRKIIKKSTWKDLHPEGNKDDVVKIEGYKPNLPAIMELFYHTNQTQPHMQNM